VVARDKTRKRNDAWAFSGYLGDLMAVPRSFVFGLLSGVLVPVAGLAGIIAGIYLLTGRVPFITHVEEEIGGRRLIVQLVGPEEARDLLRKSGEAAMSFGDEIRTELEGGGQGQTIP
jgi:hypothetical protein